jgi:hypothetical protein
MHIMMVHKFVCNIFIFVAFNIVRSTVLILLLRTSCRQSLFLLLHLAKPKMLPDHSKCVSCDGNPPITIKGAVR